MAQQRRSGNSERPAELEDLIIGSFGQVIGMVLGIILRLLAVRVILGLAASLVSVKLLVGLVRNVSTYDPYSFAAVTALLFAADVFASFWPARRAARVDPITALRDRLYGQPWPRSRW